MLLPENIDYWMTVVKLYGWLLSGLVTAILVILINETIAYTRKRYSRKSICSMLNIELALDLVLCQNRKPGESLHFQYSCWENFRSACTEFLSYDNLYYIGLAYIALRQIEAGTIDTGRQAAALASIEKAQKILEPLSAKPPK